MWGEGDKGFPYCQPWPGCSAHLLQTCPPESNTDRTPWQPNFPAKQKEKETREDKKHSHAFLSRLSSEADGSTLHTLPEQAVVQLGCCFSHTTAWSWNAKNFRNIPCEEVCIGYSCSGRERYFALSSTCLGTDASQVQIPLTTGPAVKPAHKSWGSKPILACSHGTMLVQFVCLHPISLSYYFLITSNDTWTRDRGLGDVKFLWQARRDSVAISKRKGWSQLSGLRPCKSSVSTYKWKSRVYWFYWPHRTIMNIKTW